MLNLIFVFDDYTDISDRTQSQRIVDSIMDALRNPTRLRPQDESVVGEIARQ